MIKRMFHLFLCFMFPMFVFLTLLRKVLFSDKGLGDDWLPDSDNMLDKCRGMAK